MVNSGRGLYCRQISGQDRKHYLDIFGDDLFCGRNGPNLVLPPSFIWVICHCGDWDRAQLPTCGQCMQWQCYQKEKRTIQKIKRSKKRISEPKVIWQQCLPTSSSRASIGQGGSCKHLQVLQGVCFVLSATLIKKQVHVWQNCHKNRSLYSVIRIFFPPEIVEHPQIKQVRVKEQSLAPDTIVLPTQLSD